MLGINFSEVIFIIILAVLLIRPKDLPLIFYRLGCWLRQLRGLGFLLRQNLGEIFEKIEAQINTSHPEGNASSTGEQAPLPSSTVSDHDKENSDKQ